jgi:alpha-glucosidase
MIGSPDQEPWAFGPEVEAISRKYLELRYQLLPYLYTAAWQASRTGTPMVRPLSYVYPEDTSTYSMDDQFMVGDALLVAPVMDQGAVRRDVYLPPGDWLDFWTEEAQSGGKTVPVAAPLETLPMFVKGGSIIPLWPVQQYVGEKPIDTLTLRAYWSPGHHESVLYEDDGARSDYTADDAHRVTRFILENAPEERSILLRRAIDSGRYRPSYTRINLHLHGVDAPLSRIRLSGGQLLSAGQVENNATFAIEIEATDAFDLSLSR